jgi:hypothetical protein
MQKLKIITEKQNEIVEQLEFIKLKHRNMDTLRDLTKGITHAISGATVNKDLDNDYWTDVIEDADDPLA